jgi:hypothetical protein
MKPVDTSHHLLIGLVRGLRHLKEQAAQQYQPIVDDILRTGSHDVGYIEHTLDGLLDFCDHEPVLAMYKALCRHYWHIDASAAAEYVQAYREMWDSEELGE